jgi:hypothetical protein
MLADAKNTIGYPLASLDPALNTHANSSTGNTKYPPAKLVKDANHS